MRTTFLTSTAAVTALLVGVAGPALAAPIPETETKTTTTVTSLSVPADQAISIPEDWDRWADSGTLTDTGAIAFPHEVRPYDGDFAHATFATSQEAPENCVRTVDSFSFGFSLALHLGTQEREMMVGAGIGVGEPLELSIPGAASFVYEGFGRVGEEGEYDPERAWVILPNVEVPATMYGDGILTFPESVSPDLARGYLGFVMLDEPEWTIEYANFQVTDTCTVEVEEPPVVDPPVVDPPVVEPPVVDPPVVEPPVVEPPVVDEPIVKKPVVPVVPAKPVLAETGVGLEQGILAGAGLLLVALGAVLVVRRGRLHT